MPAKPHMNYTGDFSRASIKAIEYAEALQSLAVDHIKKTFGAEDTRPNLNDLTMEQFVKALIEAEVAGTREEFEAHLAEQLLPLLDQIFGAPAPEVPS